MRNKNNLIGIKSNLYEIIYRHDNLIISLFIYFRSYKQYTVIGVDIIVKFDIFRILKSLF
jgi:hypothetical protein